MKDNRDEMLKNVLRSSPVPEELHPENIRVMLEESAPVKKRNNIKATVLKATAGAAACAVVGGFGLHYAGQKNLFNKDNSDHFLTGGYNEDETPKGDAHEGQDDGSDGDRVTRAALGSYEELYQLFGEAYESYAETQRKYEYEYAVDDMLVMEGAAEEEIMDSESSAGSNSVGDGMGDATAGGMGGGSDDHFETYNQEEGVLEADIVKTDGEYIYYLYTDFDWESTSDVCCLNIARADSGSFTEAVKLDITADFPIPDGDYDESYTYLHDMYLYNDMLIIIGTTDMYSYEERKVFSDIDGYCETSWGGYTSATYVNAYTTGTDPQLIGSYRQDGQYNDVRINKDGYLYLVTNDDTESFGFIESEENIEQYVPLSGTEITGNDVECDCIAPENIIVPGGNIEETDYLSYTIIGSVDLNTPGSISSCEELAIAGSTGNVYCSGENLYVVSGWEESEISRIALADGTVSHEATGAVSGSIKDQFSMSEHNGYFRIATTETLSEETLETYGDETYVSYNYLGETNHVFVLDMNMNIVGSISDFGIDESIKSVQFNGDMAYVVTYEQTDPLFSIDLSDPANPVILDEFKILGYSTYMQQWSDGLLLGFGASADENGIEDGIKLVMFDNSDPNNLQEVGIEMITYDPFEGDCWVYSSALAERKALLIAPEKNLIGVPYEIHTGVDNGYEYEYNVDARYEFFSYEDGDFISKGSIAKDVSSEDSSPYDRAVYIGDYLYILSAEEFVSADIETLEIYESAVF